MIRYRENTIYIRVFGKKGNWPSAFYAGGFLFQEEEVKKIFIIMIVFSLCCSAAIAEDEKKAGILGEAIDGALRPLEELLSPSQRLDPIVVTPTRYGEPSLDVSDSVTVIDEIEVRDAHSKNIPDILRTKAGIVVTDFLGNGKTNRVDMRGFGDQANSNVLVLVDGRRTNQIDMSGADWAQIDVNSVERIEIVRGPQSVLYGDNASGGVINIITKNGKNKKPAIGFAYETGSYKYNSYKGYIEGGSDFADYFGMLSSTYNYGYRVNNHLETSDIQANITIKPTETAHLSYSTGYHRDWYGMPGAVKPVDINSIGRRGSLGPNNKAKTEDYYMMFTPELTLDSAIGEIFFSGDIVSRNRWTSASFFSVWGDSITVNHINTFGITPKAAITAEVLGVENRMMVGLDFYANKHDIHSGLLSAPDTININKNNLGIYLTDTIQLPWNFIFDTGFRGEWAYYKFDQQAVVHGKNEKKPFEYACDAGLVYQYNDRSSVYAKYSRSFRFPVTDEWYNSLYVDYFSGLIAGGLNLDLKAQTGHNYEIGIKENSSKYLSVKADYYIMDLKNELYYDPIAFRNAVHHHTVHHGLELESDVYLFDKSLHVFGNYTYQKAFFVGEAFAGCEMPLVPHHKFSVGGDYIFMDCVKFGYTANYVGARPFINDLTNTHPPLKSYVTHNIKLAYNKHGFEVFGLINNILDAEYSEYGALDTFTRTMPGYYPSPRRNFVVGASCKF